MERNTETVPGISDPLATETLYLSDIASWERSKKGKIYPKGSTLLQVSASKGELIYLEENQTVKPSMYAVITPIEVTEGCPKIDGRYLFAILHHFLPKFLRKTQTGLNIQPEILYELRMAVHILPETQKNVADAWFEIDRQEKQKQELLNALKTGKAYLLQHMFPGGGQNVPDLRFTDFH